MSAGGWVKIHRRLQLWEWYTDSAMVHLFLHLLLSANREAGNWRGIPVKRGQLITGRKSLSKETGISERTIRTCLKRLKSTSELTIETTNLYSIITICNYDEYQSREGESDQQNDQPTANERPASDHKQEVKKLKKEAYCANFLKFWSVFDDKRGKEPAWKAWLKLSPDDELVKEIIAGAERYAAMRPSLVTKGQTPKMAQGWLTDRRWEDEPSTPKVVQMFQQSPQGYM